MNPHPHLWEKLFFFLLTTSFPDPPTLKSRTQTGESENSSDETFPSLRKFCLTHREIVEPLLVFCTHGIRMRDTRCCGMVLRLFISLVPEFHLGSGQGSRKPPTQHSHDNRSSSSAIASAPSDTTLVPQEIASAIREYISSDVLKACITSFHEPYFVEVQKELASLIATIMVHYGPLTSTPGDILLSLPNVNAADLERLAVYMAKPGSHIRQQRAIVLELLKDLKGVSVSEMGKLAKSAGFGNPSRSRKTTRSKMAQGFMTKEAGESGAGEGVSGTTEPRSTSDGLEGLASLFES